MNMYSKRCLLTVVTAVLMFLVSNTPRLVLNLTEYSPGEGLHLGDMNMNSRYLITRQQPDPVKARRSHNIMKIIGQRQLSYLIVMSDSTVGCRLSTTAAALSPT